MNKIAIVNDMSGFGRCSLTAALPVISVLGVQACPFPTAILSSQTGYPSYECVDFTMHMGDFHKEWTKLDVNFNVIYTGFVSCEKQIDEIFKFINSFHHTDNLLLVDPIMGDDGENYDMFSDELLKKMIKLTSYANIITPNLTELCLITRTNYKELTSISHKETILSTINTMCKEILSDTLNEVIVTGVHFLENDIDMVANVLISHTDIFYTAHPYLGGSYSGTGDLFASCISGGLAKGITTKEMIKIASNFLYESIKDAISHNIPFEEGVEFENHLHRLINISK